MVVAASLTDALTRLPGRARRSVDLDDVGEVVGEDAARLGHEEAVVPARSRAATSMLAATQRTLTARPDGLADAGLDAPACFRSAILRGSLLLREAEGDDVAVERRRGGTSSDERLDDRLTAQGRRRCPANRRRALQVERAPALVPIGRRGGRRRPPARRAVRAWSVGFWSGRRSEARVGLVGSPVPWCRRRGRRLAASRWAASTAVGCLGGADVGAAPVLGGWRRATGSRARPMASRAPGGLDRRASRRLGGLGRGCRHGRGSRCRYRSASRRTGRARAGGEGRRCRHGRDRWRSAGGPRRSGRHPDPCRPSRLPRRAACERLRPPGPATPAGRGRALRVGRGSRCPRPRRRSATPRRILRRPRRRRGRAGRGRRARSRRRSSSTAAGRGSTRRRACHRRPDAR